MAVVAAQDDVRANRKERETPTGRAWRTDFIRDDSVHSAPMAFLAEGAPGRVIRPHFHECDQFQVIVSGGGALGRHPLSIHAVHFTRAHTPYGPLVAGEEGLGFLTLRPRWDPGAQYLPDAREKLQSVPDRKPWQATEAPQFAPTEGMQVHPFADLRDERGLAVWSVTLGPGRSGAAPSAAASGGQYIIVTRGTLMHQDKAHAPITIVWVNPDEAAFPLLAGPEGLEALVLNFPSREEAGSLIAAPSTDSSYRVWQCALCAFVYDEAKGIPEEGIAPGTRWEDVPEDWICPDCAAGKADFDMQVVG